MTKAKLFPAGLAVYHEEEAPHDFILLDWVNSEKRARAVSMMKDWVAERFKEDTL